MVLTLAKNRLGAHQGPQHHGVPATRQAHLQPGPARVHLEEEGPDRPGDDFKKHDRP